MGTLLGDVHTIDYFRIPHNTHCLPPKFWLRSIGKFGFRIVQSNAKSENPSSMWIPIKKSKSGFHGFPFYRSIGKSEKGFAKLFSWTAVFFLLITRARAKPLFLRTVFQILFRISQSNGKKEIQKHISQRWNPFSNFAFDCKSAIRILKSKSRFPNWMHPLLLSSTALGKMLPGAFENNGLCKIWRANRVYF